MTTKLTFLSLLILFLISCEEIKNNSIQYSETINKKWFDLSKTLGDSTLIYNDEDSIKIFIKYNSKEKINLITNQSDDTLFIGKANKFKKLYLLYRELNNNNFVIHALKIKDSLITGFCTEFLQNILFKELVETDIFKRNIADTANGKTFIDPKKRDLKKIYSNILDSLPSMLFKDLTEKEHGKSGDFVTETIREQEEFAPLKTEIYPNPFYEQLTITSAPKGETIQVRNHEGILTHKEQVIHETTTINCQDFPKGVYFVKIGSTITRLIKN